MLLISLRLPKETIVFWEEEAKKQGLLFSEAIRRKLLPIEKFERINK